MCEWRVSSGLVTQCISDGWKIPSARISFLELSLAIKHPHNDIPYFCSGESEKGAIKVDVRSGLEL